MGGPTNSTSISETSTTSTSTIQNWTDSFNETVNNVKNWENIGNITLGYNPSGEGTSMITSSGIILPLIVIGAIILLVMIFRR